MQKAGYVRPGFLLGERRGKKYYVNNHLVFTVLVHVSHGEYREARANLNANLAMESLDVRKLLADVKDVKAQDPKAKDAKAKDTKAKDPKAKAPKAKVPEAKDPKAKAAAAETKPQAPAAKELPTLYMVVGFEVRPCSIKRTPNKPVDNVVCDGTQEMQEVKLGEKIVYTYDVYFETSKHKWASRWDAYLKMPGGKV